MASQLKRDLLALQANQNKQIGPMSRASKTASKATTVTASKSKNHPKAGGTAKIGSKHPTGHDRGPTTAPKITQRQSGVLFSKPTPTGKATPSAKPIGSAKQRMGGMGGR